MEENTKEISLSQLWTVAKKAFKMGLIYVLVSVIVVGAVLSLVRSLGRKSNNVSVISIGGEVDGTAIITLDSNKTSAINDALKDFKGGSKTDLSSEIWKNLSIVDDVSNELTDKDSAVVVPSSFKLILSKSDKMGLTQDESNEVLSLISKSLLNLWDKKSIEKVSFNIDIDSEIKLKEYYQVIEGLSNRVDRLVATISENIDVFNTNLKVENKDFNRVLADLGSITEELNVLRKFTTNYAVEKGNKNESGNFVTTGNLLLAYTKDKEKTDDEVIAWQKKKDDIDGRINKYVEEIPSKITPVTSATGSVSYVYDDSTYLELTKISLEYSEILQEVTMKQKELGYNIANVSANSSASDDLKISRSDYVSNELRTIVNSIDEVIANYKRTMDIVEDSAYSYSGSIIKVPAKTVYTDAISIKLMAVILIVVAFGAYFVSFVQTYSKLKKKNFFEEPNKEIEQF